MPKVPKTRLSHPLECTICYVRCQSRAGLTQHHNYKHRATSQPPPPDMSADELVHNNDIDPDSESDDSHDSESVVSDVSDVPQTESVVSDVSDVPQTPIEDEDNDEFFEAFQI